MQVMNTCLISSCLRCFYRKCRSSLQVKVVREMPSSSHQETAYSILDAIRKGDCCWVMQAFINQSYKKYRI
jgi:hypothetical protein